MSQTQTETPTPTPPLKANPYRGEALVEVNGKQYIFCLNIGALADLAQAFGTANNQSLFERLAGPLVDIGNGVQMRAGPSVADLPAIIAAISAGAISGAEVRGYGVSQIRELMQAIEKVTLLSQPEDSPEKKSADAAAEASASQSPSTNGGDLPEGS